jgi:hypothetical protein
MSGAIHPLPQYAFMAWCSVKAQGQLYLYCSQSFIQCEVEALSVREKQLELALNSPYTSMYPKVPGLAAWSENCKWYSSLQLGAVASLFCESV